MLQGVLFIEFHIELFSVEKYDNPEKSLWSLAQYKVHSLSQLKV